MREESPSIGSHVLRGIGFALGLVALTALLFVYRLYVGKDIPLSWIGLAVNTPIVFWYPVYEHRRYWRRPQFWLALTGLLTIHALAFFILLRSYPEWPLMWFLPTDLIEVWLIYLGLYSSVRPHWKYEQKGFSLIEVPIIVTFIIIFAAISIPNLLRSRMAANEAFAGSVRALNVAALEYQSTNGAFPTNIAQIRH